jgi:hypothetical protein
MVLDLVGGPAVGLRGALDGGDGLGRLPVGHLG